MKTTGNNKTPDFYRHIYRVHQKNKSYTVYELIGLKGGFNHLAEILRIEPYQEKSKSSGITKYLRLRTTGNWKTSEAVTGLRPTTVKGIYYGDKKTADKKSLLIFHFTEGKNYITQEPEVWLIIDVFYSFYPENPTILKKIIKTYETK